MTLIALQGQSPLSFKRISSDQTLNYGYYRLKSMPGKSDGVPPYTGRNLRMHSDIPHIGVLFCVLTVYVAPLAIVRFNRLPLLPALILPWASHPQLAPPTTIARWTQAQELVADGFLQRIEATIAKAPLSHGEPLA